MATTEQESLNAISAAALQVCSREELVQMPRPQRSSLMHLIAKRLDRLPPPTQDELQGIKELVLDHLSHPALAALSPESRTQSPGGQTVQVDPAKGSALLKKLLGHMLPIVLEPVPPMKPKADT